MTDPTAPMPTGEPEPTVPWSPPSAPAPGLAAPGQTLARPLPGSILASGVLLLVGAALAGLWALILFTQLLINQKQLDSLEQMVLLIFGGVSVLAAIPYLLAGIGVLRRRSWARILGLVLSVLGSLIFGLGLVASLTQPVDESLLAAIYGIGLAVYVCVGFALARRGAEFG